MRFIIRQVSAKNCDKYPAGNLWKYDFCRSKKWEKETDRYLYNQRNNGWRNDETAGSYTKFKLELIK